MSPKIGPTGTYPFGGPAQAGDRGGLNMGFQRVPGQRLFSLSFGTVLNKLAGTESESRNFASNMRRMVTQAFGAMPYNAATLPLYVAANNTTRTVDIVLPAPTTGVVANPEVWLALSWKIEQECAKLAKLN